MSTTADIATKIDQSSIIKAKPMVILKEEADNWGILYDPDKDLSFTINTVGAFIWKRLNTDISIK